MATSISTCVLCCSLNLTPLGINSNGEKIEIVLDSRNSTDQEKRAKLLKNIRKNLSILLGNDRFTKEIPEAADDLLLKNFSEIADLKPEDIRY